MSTNKSLWETTLIGEPGRFDASAIPWPLKVADFRLAKRVVGSFVSGVASL